MKLVILLFCLHSMITPVSALEIEAPEVPDVGKEWMPENTESILDAIMDLLQHASEALSFHLREASVVCAGIFAVVMLITLLETVSPYTKSAAQIAGTTAISLLLFQGTNSLICLASDTIIEIGEYGKLLLPVMTAALAAQGGITGSASLYAGTALFSSILQSVMSRYFIPGVYLYLALYVANGATHENILKNISDLLKTLMTWLLKIMLMIFTTFLSLSGVITGTTDAAALKATKVMVSSFVPIVGGALSDASDAVLISAGVLKNAAGIYGIFAILALFLQPFIKIGTQYMMLKFTAAISSVFSDTWLAGVIQGFSNALGLLLGMSATASVLILVSTVCFMKGVT